MVTNKVKGGSLFGKYAERGEPYDIERYKAFALPYITEALRDEITDASEMLDRRKLCHGIGQTLNVPDSWVLNAYTDGGFHQKNVEERQKAIRYEFDVFVGEGFTISAALASIAEKYALTKDSTARLIGRDYVKKRRGEIYKEALEEVAKVVADGETIVDACTIVGMRRGLNECTLKNYYSNGKYRG